MSKTNPNPNARDVLVYQDKEITREHMATLSDEEVTKVKKRTNGPHHYAKWALDLSDKLVPYNRVKRNMFGDPTTVELRNMIVNKDRYCYWSHQRLAHVTGHYFMLTSTRTQLETMILSLQKVQAFVRENPLYVENSSLEDDIQYLAELVKELVQDHLLQWNRTEKNSYSWRQQHLKVS